MRYYGIFAGFMVAYLSVVLLLVARADALARVLVGVAIARAALDAAGAPAFAHYLRSRTKPDSAVRSTTPRLYSAYCRSYLASASHAHNWMLAIIKDWNQEVLFPGFLAIALGGLGMFAAATGSDSEPARGGRLAAGTRNTARCTAASAILAFWASLGPRAGLYSLLFNTVPVFSLLRAPGRTGIIVTLVLALFAAFGVRALRRRTRRTHGRLGRMRHMRPGATGAERHSHRLARCSCHLPRL